VAERALAAEELEATRAAHAVELAGAAEVNATALAEADAALRTALEDQRTRSENALKVALEEARVDHAAAAQALAARGAAREESERQRTAEYERDVEAARPSAFK